jgi:hypothetical protein
VSGPDPIQPNHTEAFDILVRTAYLGQDTARTSATFIDALMKIRDDELVLLSQVRAESKVSVYQEAIAAEVARRTTAALVAFKDQSKIASDRLEGLTKWLIAFTIAVVVLTVVVAALTGIVAWHDLTH